jgi:hypothetical protein
VFTGEWLPAVDVMSGHSLGRYPDGHDTDDNSLDFNDYAAPTPGITNPVIGIAEYKEKADLLPMPAITNPIRSGVHYGALYNHQRYYPLFIYNTMGQVVEEVRASEKVMTLPTGVYFLKPRNIAKVCEKLVVLR